MLCELDPRLGRQSKPRVQDRHSLFLACHSRGLRQLLQRVGHVVRVWDFSARRRHGHSLLRMCGLLLNIASDTGVLAVSSQSLIEVGHTYFTMLFIGIVWISTVWHVDTWHSCFQGTRLCHNFDAFHAGRRESCWRPQQAPGGEILCHGFGAVGPPMLA